MQCQIVVTNMDLDNKTEPPCKKKTALTNIDLIASWLKCLLSTHGQVMITHMDLDNKTEPPCKKTALTNIDLIANWSKCLLSTHGQVMTTNMDLENTPECRCQKGTHYHRPYRKLLKMPAFNALSSYDH